MDTCLPFKCTVSTGVCKVACASSEECADNYVCDSTGKTCVPGSAADSAAPNNGCGCRVAGGGSSDGNPGTPTYAGLGLVFALGLMRRRRRGHNPA
jgi:hypothetical protein